MRKSLVAALLLPLPFAALPVLSVFVMPAGGGDGQLVVSNAGAAVEMLDQPASVSETTEPVSSAFNLDMPHQGCGGEGLASVEG